MRRLRRFVVELCSSGSGAQLCEFGFVGAHVEQTGLILAELAASSDPSKVAPVCFLLVLFLFHL